MELKPVSKTEFYKAIGPRDVVSSIVSGWPYAMEFNLRYGGLVGKTVDFLPENSALTETKYFLNANQ